MVNELNGVGVIVSMVVAVGERVQEHFELEQLLIQQVRLVKSSFHCLRPLEHWNFNLDLPHLLDAVEGHNTQRLAHVGSVRHVLGVVQEVGVGEDAPSVDVLLRGETRFVLKQFSLELDLLVVHYSFVADVANSVECLR